MRYNPGMDRDELEKALSGLLLGGLSYFERTGSTNDEAARWADRGAPDLALVVADEQTAGRGRGGRKWFTPPGAALAISLVLRELPRVAEDSVSWLTALGAVALCSALQEDYQLRAQIKWPNDVLLNQRKTAGILAEAYWHGNELSTVILGIGINVAPESVPPDSEVIFPATCVQAALGRPLDRWGLLRSFLFHLLDWRPRLGSPEFLQTWQAQLAFVGNYVNVIEESSPRITHSRVGMVLGLDAQGRLRLRDRAGDTFTLQVGELRLRPVEFV